MTELDWLQLIDQDLIDTMTQSQIISNTASSKVEVVKSMLATQNSTLNSQLVVVSSNLEVQNSKLEVQNSTLNSQLETVSSNLEVQNSTLNSQLVVVSSNLEVQNSKIDSQFVTDNSYNDVFVGNAVTGSSSSGYNSNLLQYQNNKLIEFKTYDFIFFAIIIAALLVLIIVRGFKRV